MGVGFIMTSFDKAWGVVKAEWTPDNLWVVAENQMGGWEACDSIDGHLMTYATFEEANHDAMAVVDDLNEGILDDERTIEEYGYHPDDWGAQLLNRVAIADNQEHITLPSGESMPLEEWCMMYPRTNWRGRR
jgi:hypothetical protein